MIAKGSVLIGVETRFGPDWPGQRCGAKTRQCSPCKRPANKRNCRCRLHGGASSGPRTKEGLAMIARRKKDAKIAKGLRDRLRVIEQNLRRHGIIV